MVKRVDDAKCDTNDAKQSDSVLRLVHSDVGGKMSSQSLNDSEYFLTFIYDTWMYILKHILIYIAVYIRSISLNSSGVESTS